MLLSKLVGERTKTSPADATAISHILLIRAGFIKLVANGIWSLAMPAKRIAKKIEQIIREEMDAIDGQEVLFPVVMPKEMWAESGRYFSIGDEMVRFKDRSGRDMVLGMTHEEAAVQFARDTVNSYQQLPFMIYQIHQQDAELRGEARGISIGEKRGISIGEERKAIDTAKSMMRENLPDDMISRVTGLAVGEVKKLSVSFAADQAKNA